MNADKYCSAPQGQAAEKSTSTSLLPEIGIIGDALQEAVTTKYCKYLTSSFELQLTET